VLHAIAKKEFAPAVEHAETYFFIYDSEGTFRIVCGWSWPGIPFYVKA